MRFYLKNILIALLLLSTNFTAIKQLYSNNEITTSFSVTLFIFTIYLAISSLLYPFRYFWFLINGLILLINAALSYYIYNYGLVISATLIQSIFDTDNSEVKELLNLNLFFWVLLFGILPVFILFLSRFKESFIKFNYFLYLKSLIITLILMSMSMILMPKTIHTIRYLKMSLSAFMPFNYILSVKNYLIVEGASSDNIRNINRVYSFTFDKHTPKNLNIILVIGESSRKDHWGINGYKRDTTPNLAKIGNLISYDNVYALATNTLEGVQNIMHLKDHYNLTSFISVFDDLGFKTHWFSNQGIRYDINNHKGRNYHIINSIVAETKNYVFSNDIGSAKQGSNYDADLLPYVTPLLTDKNNNLIILHTKGSHRLYDLRYPAEYQIFKPTCVGDQIHYGERECTDVVKSINSYDNSILYTDYFLSSLINQSAAHNALVIYISDHGESLGEDGVFGHAHPIASAPRAQTDIPLILWASKQFLSKNSQMLTNARTHEHNYIDQSFIFHTILDCAGIKSDIIDLNKSLCRVANEVK